MVIDKGNGKVNLGIGIIDSNITLDLFKKMKAFKKAELNVDNPPWQTFRLKDIPLTFENESYHVYALLVFKKDRIYSIDLSFLDDVCMDAVIDNEIEKVRKKFYDRFLTTELGHQPYKYKWGQVESYFDPKGGSSGIIVTYI